jgi:hypothetical protein
VAALETNPFALLDVGLIERSFQYVSRAHLAGVTVQPKLHSTGRRRSVRRIRQVPMAFRKSFVLCGVALIWLVLGSIVAEPPSGSLPFQAGEKLSYRISWSSIVEAGTAELSATAEDGRPNSLRLQAKALTAAAVAASYPFKDDFVSHFDILTRSPWLYEKNFTERKRVIRDRVAFNQAQGTALFTNSRNQSKQIAIELGTQDPVSSLYAVRGIGLTPGMRVTFPVLDGGVQYALEARVVAAEFITVKLGSFNAHRVEVNLRRESVPVANRSITAWISTDARRLPVLVSVALPVGAAVIELISVSP